MKESPFEHLPRRSFFVDEPVHEKLIHAQPNKLAIKRTEPNKRTQEPGINGQTKLEAARAALEAIGQPAVAPEPLVDTTVAKGRGRPKKWASDAERKAAKRKATPAG